MAIAQIESRFQAFASKLRIPKWFLLLLLQFIALNFLMSFIFGIPDYPYYLDHLTYLKRNINPYVYDATYRKYPAAYFLFLGLLGLLGINSSYSLKMVYACFDILNILFLYKICSVRLKITSDARIMAILSLYFYNFLHLVNRITGENDVVAISMLLISVYYFLGDQYGKSAIYLSLGINFKVFPIFFLIPASLFFLKNRKIKEGIYYWLLQALGFFLISLYYLIQNPMAFIESLLWHTSRITTGFSWARMVEPIYSTAIEIFGIRISYMFIIQISVLIFITLIGWFRNKEFGSAELIYWLVLVMSLYPLITNYDVHTVFEKFFPLAIILMISPLVMNFQTIKKFGRIMFMFHFIALAMFLVVQYNQAMHWVPENVYDYLAYYHNPMYEPLKLGSVILFLYLMWRLLEVRKHSYYYVLLYNIIYLIAVVFVSVANRDDLHLVFIIRVVLHFVCIMLSISIFKKFKSGSITECEDMERSEESIREKEAILFNNPKYVFIKIASLKQSAERISFLEKCASNVDQRKYYEILKAIQTKSEILKEDTMFSDFISEEVQKMNELKGALDSEQNTI